MKAQHHFCLYKEYCTFDGVGIPYGTRLIEETLTETLSSLLDEVIPKIGEGDIIVCGEDPVRRMVGRKLEDRLGREVKYE